RPKALIVAQGRQPTQDAEKDVLHDVVDVDHAHPLGDEGAQLRLQRAPGPVAREVRGVDVVDHDAVSDPQHEGAQHEPPGLTASMVAEATYSSIPEPGIQFRMNSRL